MKNQAYEIAFKSFKPMVVSLFGGMYGKAIHQHQLNDYITNRKADKILLEIVTDDVLKELIKLILTNPITSDQLKSVEIVSKRFGLDDYLAHYAEYHSDCNKSLVRTVVDLNSALVYIVGGYRKLTDTWHYGFIIETPKPS